MGRPCCTARASVSPASSATARARRRGSGIDVVSDFRSADVAAGGEGAPLIPLYHAAIAAGLEKPLMVLNWGGVGNVTYLGADGEILAFDTGPANALIDDFVARRRGLAYDEGGALAASGRVDDDHRRSAACATPISRAPRRNRSTAIIFMPRWPQSSG